MRYAHHIHMMDPEPEGEKRHRHDGNDHRAIADKRMPCKDRDQNGEHSRRRQENDVNLRMAEEPEEVLPEQRIATPLRIKEWQAKRALELQQDRAQNERREGEEHHRANDEHVPREDWHPAKRHARRAYLQNTDDEFHGGADGGDLHEGYAKQPDIRIDTRRMGAG